MYIKCNFLNYIYIYIYICVCEKDLALNNHQGFIYHKTHPKQTKAKN